MPTRGWCVCEVRRTLSPPCAGFLFDAVDGIAASQVGGGVAVPVFGHFTVKNPDGNLRSMSRARRREVAMDETMVGVAIGFSALMIAALFVVGHYRREHLRRRMISGMHGHRLYDFTRPRH